MTYNSPGIPISWLMIFSIMERVFTTHIESWNVDVVFGENETSRTSSKFNSPSCLCNSRWNHHTCLLIVCIHTKPTILPFNKPTSIYSKHWKQRKTIGIQPPPPFLGAPRYPTFQDLLLPVVFPTTAFV